MIAGELYHPIVCTCGQQFTSQADRRRHITHTNHPLPEPPEFQPGRPTR